MPEPVTTLTIGGYLAIQAIAQAISQSVAAFNAYKQRESQEKIAADNRNFQTESQAKLQEQDAKNKIALAKLDHEHKLDIVSQAHVNKLAELGHQRKFQLWPLYNSPEEIRRSALSTPGFPRLSVLVAPLVIAHQKTGAAIPPELLEKQAIIDHSLRLFLDKNYHRDFDRPVYYIDEAWRLDARIFGESAILSLFDWIHDLPILVIQPCAVGKEIAEMRFWFWDFGFSKPNYGSFDLTNFPSQVNMPAGESARTLSRVYEFLVATVADWRFLAQSKGSVLPLFPGICQSNKAVPIATGDFFTAKALDSAIAGYEKIISAIAKDQPQEALRIWAAIKSKFEELKYEDGVKQINNYLARFARQAKSSENIQDHLSRFELRLGN